MQILPLPRAPVLSLYRSCLRQIRLLPTDYLRLFFRIKTKDDVRSAYQRDDSRSYNNAIQRVVKTTKVLQRANSGELHAFTRILDLAYGRTGKLKWELNEPLLTDPNLPKPPPIIRNDPKSSPPVYPPPLQALLFDSKARINGKSLSPSKLEYPKNYPRHGIPDTEEAKILGPLSKRRQKNLLWRAFAKETGKLWPPLQLVVSERGLNTEEISDPASLLNQGVKPIGFQGQGLYEELEKIAGFSPKNLTRRERKALGIPTPRPISQLTLHPKSRLTGRFVKRRIRQLLDKIPVLRYSYSSEIDAKPGSYNVRFSPHVLSAQKRSAFVKSELAQPADLEWIEHTRNHRSS